MQLWNDYEGKTIADVYSLGTLLRPEGRSALFSLPEGAEAPAMIRLTESLNDESQMLACWRRVAEVHQENLVTLKRFGETTYQGTPLTYAVMEPADANLADLLKERPLTHAEAMQVAASLVAALSALHAKGLVHEHVDAANVLAIGETVKLRTDCVRECVIDPEHLTAEDCAKLIQKDVQDLSALLLRALTLEKRLTPRVKLAAPFDQIIPNGMSGTWGLAEMARVLTPPSAVAATPSAAGTASSAAAEPVAVREPEETAADSPLRYRRQVQDNGIEEKGRSPLLAGLAIVAIVVLAILLHGMKGKPTSTAAAASSEPVKQVVVKTPAAPVSRAAAPVAQAGAPVTAANGTPAVGHLAPGWYVVAYTFNHAEQAMKRAEAIAKQHPGLRPEVIAPGGRAPYLVALGGAMSRTEAEQARDRARRSGMPRDTFARNYKGS